MGGEDFWRQDQVDDARVDGLTSVFGAFGRPTTASIDVGLGTLRAIPELSDLWEKASAGDVCASIEEYPGTQGSLRFCDAVTEVVAAERGVD